MIIFITGTPGTGKTTVSHQLKELLKIELVEVNQLVEDENLYTGYDEEWGYKVVDIPSLCNSLGDIITSLKGDLLVEGHLSHFCDGADVVVVLRANPYALEKRLQSKGFKEPKIRENITAEALDICAYEAYQKYQNKAHEIDTTHKTPQEVVEMIEQIVMGKKSYPVGEVDFSEFFYSR